MEIEVIQRKGKRLAVDVYLSEHARAYALIVHGLGGTKTQPHLVQLAEKLSENNITAIVFDAADGLGASEGTFKEATATGLVHDAEDVLAALTRESWYVSSLPRILIGHSLGGLAVLRILRTKKDIAGAVLLAPALSWRFSLRGFILRTIPWLLRGYTMMDIRGTAHRLNRTFLLDYLRQSGFRNAEAITIPVLIVSGTADRAVSLFAQRRLAALLPSSTHEVIEGARHNFPGYEHDVALRTVQFIEKNIVT
jgi:alpha-beta hydrolase superfamily lysophospholipase